MIDPATFPLLPLHLSVARLQPYVDAEGGDLGRGLRLYTWNVEVSTAFWGVLHAVEIALRNAMHVQLAARFGQGDWWNAGVRLTHIHQKMIDKANDDAASVARRNGRSATPGDVVAALSFGFWTGLTGPGRPYQYETQLWQPALVGAFPNLASTRRGDVGRTLESLRLFRNRVAHHEPVFRRHLAADHATLLRVAEDIDVDLARYIAAHSRVPAALARRSECVASGISTSF